MELEYKNKNGYKINIGSYEPYILKNTTGIAEVENVFQTHTVPGYDGEVVISSRLGPRRISIEGECTSDSVSFRDKFIKIFNPKVEGVLTVTLNNIQRFIKVEPEGVLYMPHVMRPPFPFAVDLFAADPFFRDSESEIGWVSEWIGKFEFPLCIEIENELQGIELGYRKPNLIVNIVNKGMVESGVKIVFKAESTVINPALYNVKTSEFIKLKSAMLPGDVIEINTNLKRKKIERIRNKKRSNIFSELDLESTFITLKVGDNLFRATADEGELYLDCYIIWDSKFLGV